LIGLYALTLSQAYMPHVNYWMNRDFIASVLCENKEKPELECNGKCHLKKQIQENSDDNPEGEEVSSQMMVEFFEPTIDHTVEWLVETITNSFYNYSEPLETGFSSSVFHPPRV
jgi:hypothetical protein